MKKIAGVTAISVSALAMSASMSFADYTLNILHINDWHSRIESNNKFESTCSAEEEGKGECFGGAARLITALKQERDRLSGQNVIFLDAGDNFQGSLFYTTYKGKAESEFLNQMKPDAMTLGNHEFDDGEDAIAPFLDVAMFPVTTANVKPNAQSKLGDHVKSSVVLEIGGQKIGIVGGLTNDVVDIASPGPNITIEDDVKAITAEVEKLKAEGVNKIIALTHIGYNRERDVIAKIPGIDVVVGGHSHSLLSNTDPKAEGPYPTMVDNPDGYKVPVIQAASYSKYLGEIKVVFDDNGVVKEATGAPILLDKSITPDPAVLARIKELGAPIEELKAKEVSETTAPIDGSRDNCRARECEMGNLVSDAVLDRVKGQGVEIVFTNGGGLRASIDQGVVTMGEVLTVLPFQNTVATFKITGKDVVDALENGVSQIEDGAGRFAQVAGLKYAFDKSQPAGSRVSDVQVMENGVWTPVDSGKTYLAATNNYVRQGGDGYKVFASNAQNAYDYGPGLEQVVADYLAAHRPYKPYLDGRITEIGTTTAQAETAPSAESAPTAGDAANPPKPDNAAPATAAPNAQPEAPSAQGGTATETKPAEAATTPSSHVVVAGDTYWDLAETYYKNGAKWHDIADANPGDKPRFLGIGKTLKIPAAK
ncbi:5'-nucleotidase C-terminal domain-containing protein [Mesorhizobium sp. BAC0120]|uniref:5'-nucleotidase C-terminal domain-containing protein n=1 Tax=Mesorhizobium sp. BAC0120 TaxID=3090670 RepID=UPI00298C011A|nr:5'-nucleotidase C-terminal domain-containing protein [Mesorhizobium sp. BAC0120]MDW6025057.1 5'-nucleotidase C-terminal domain-containing protein [Mesorhizobium sp. BAC0120]